MYARYNYFGVTPSTVTNQLADIVKLLCGCIDKTQLNGKFYLGNQAVGITNTSTTVTWAGANTNVTCAVGQSVSGTGIPAGTTIATITDQTGFTLSQAATATNAAACLILGPTATLPAQSIGKGVNVSTTNASTTVSLTGASTSGLVAGQKISGYGIPASTTISSVTTNSFVISNAATVTGATTVVIEPGTPNCDTTNTYILATGTTPAGYTDAGWTVWDSYAQSGGKPNQVVLRQPVNDDSTKYIYLLLDVYSAGYLQMSLYETWDNSAHSGTNACTVSSAYQPQIAIAPGFMLISSSPKHVAIQSTIYTGAIGATNASEWTGVFQRTRKSPWDTVANGYPPAVIITGQSVINGFAYQGVAPRFKNPAGGDYTSTAVYGAFIGGGGTSGISIQSTLTSKVPDGLGGFYVPLLELLVQRADYSFLGGSISALADVWLSVSYPKNQDECSANGKSYVFWQNTSAPATYSNCAFPKG